ncbi:MAG: EAL domain-containing protein [Deltaproteobacteria bacterium]|nr:EAL domain-containing protein [Deltaproteobacteria bacterium]
MLSPLSVILAFFVYMAVLFAFAIWAERRGAKGGRSSATHPAIYALSLGSYCTAWTYYGSVGFATNNGPAFLAIYLGPTLSALAWWVILRKLVAIKANHRITSIADFISTRYGRSQTVAALVTCLAALASMPYIALQLKSIISTFGMITAASGTASGVSAFISDNVGPVVVALMIGFTVAFGVRRISPAERHQGMVLAISVESVVKLVAFLVVGVYVTFVIFDGPSDLTQKFAASGHDLVALGHQNASYAQWMTLMVLSFSAILFLPRQFHVAVVENSEPRHVLTAMWMFPAYMLLINLFVVPIAMAGVASGLPPNGADTFLLDLPMKNGSSFVAMIVFIGGFSAASSMIIVSVVANATMITNHLLLPVIQRASFLVLLRRRILELRWIAVGAVILVGYWFETIIGSSYLLANIGLIAFAGALQFAPPILLGIFWRRANRAGATLGLVIGFVLWAYTMLLPAIVRSGLGSADILTYGPLNIFWLRPEALFGISALSGAVVHTTFWSVLGNVGGLVAGSLLFSQSDGERALAESFVGDQALNANVVDEHGAEATVHLRLKMEALIALLRQYFGDSEARVVLRRSLDAVGQTDREWCSVREFAALVSDIEKTLAGSFGSAAANRIVMSARLYSPEEAESLTRFYSRLLARMKVSPDELRHKIDYFHERERLLERHANALELKVRERDQEISERIKVQDALRRAEEKYRSIFENATEGIFQASKDGRFISANPSMARILGYTSPEHLIADIRDINTQVFVSGEQRELFWSSLAKQSRVFGLEAQIFRHDHTMIWASIHARAVGGHDERAPFIEGTLVDITAQKTLMEELARTAFYDELTGLPNRALFMDRLRQALERSKRRRDYHFAVLFMDLDRFKNINDSFGHIVGDRLLVSFAERVKNCVRAIDIFARFGGDEFAILLEELGDMNEVMTISQRIEHALHEPIVLDGNDLFFTTSIGIVLDTALYKTAEDVLRDADTALYRAKGLGRGRQQIFDHAMREHTLRQFELETSMRRALERNELILHYQPIVSLPEGKITGLEALCRWQHPRDGLLMAGGFIPLAEETGLIGPLGYWILEEACRAAVTWQRSIANFTKLVINVNVSGRQLPQSDLCDRIEGIIRDTGIDPQCLKLEITESVLVENADTAANVLGRLKTAGVRIAIDDFGTGYSSLSYLQRFPVDTLKVDRSFISQMGLSKERTEIVRTIIDLAHNLGMDTVAEGVETFDQVSRLVSFGCEYAQGYLFGRPTGVDEMTALMISGLDIQSLGE